MSDEETKGKIKEVIENPGVSIEKGVKKGLDTIKDFGKNEKIKEVVDNPGVSIEKGVKKGWKTVKDYGKEVIKKIKKEEKK